MRRRSVLVLSALLLLAGSVQASFEPASSTKLAYGAGVPDRNISNRNHSNPNLSNLSNQQEPPDRSQPPRTGPPPELKLPQIEKRTLTNGIPVWLVQMHEVPVVQISLLVQGGASADPAGKFGLASLTAAMLDEGAGNRSSLELADAVDFLGASIAPFSSFDTSGVGLWVPVARVREALGLLADVALRPTFPPDELERLRKERLTSLMEARDDPGEIASMAFPRLVYGPAYRYGTPEVGTIATVRGFSAADLRSFYAANYRPQNSSLVVVGDVTLDAIVPLLEQAFGSWKSETPAPAAATLAPAPQLTARQVVIVDKPGAAQSEIRLGWVGVARGTPDYFPLVVLNTVLGGSFTSRLNQNLRERHGYAYGAGSTFDMRKSAGPFVAAAAVQTDKTTEALEEFFNELNGIVKPIPETELQRAKNYVALGYPEGFETTGDLARKLQAMITYGLPPDYFANYVKNVEAVTPAEVDRIAAKYIQPDKFVVLVVGDRKLIEPGIRKVGLGPVKVLSVEQALGDAAPAKARQ